MTFDRGHLHRALALKADNSIFAVFFVNMQLYYEPLEVERFLKYLLRRLNRFIKTIVSSKTPCPSHKVFLNEELNVARFMQGCKMCYLFMQIYQLRLFETKEKVGSIVEMLLLNSKIMIILKCKSWALEP